MPVNRDFIGRKYPASGVYEVSREKIRDFAVAIGDANPAYVDPAAAAELGYADVVAPPTFLTVLTFRFSADTPVVDPELGLDYALVVHGEQAFVSHRPVIAGDKLHSVTSVADIRNAGRNELVTLVAEVTDGSGDRVATLTSTLVSRGSAASVPDAVAV